MHSMSASMMTGAPIISERHHFRSVRETKHAMADGTPYLFCDKKCSSDLELRVITHGGETVQVRASDRCSGHDHSRNRCHLRDGDAFFVVFNDHDTFDARSGAASLVRQQAMDGRPRAPVALIQADYCIQSPERLQRGMLGIGDG